MDDAMKMVIPNDVPSLNVSPHVMGTKGPVVHLAHFIKVLDANYLSRKKTDSGYQWPYMVFLGNTSDHIHPEM